MKTKFQMTEEQLKKLMDACRPVPYIIVGGAPPRSQQKNANDAWKALGEEMGFDYETVESALGCSQLFFMAVKKE